MNKASKGNLTPKQHRFVDEYLVDLNATQAAIRTGYSPRTANEQAARLLAKASITEAVRIAQMARAERTGVTADQVLEELAKIGFADIRKAVQWGEGLAVPDAVTGEIRIANGIGMVGSQQLDDRTAAAIAEVAQTRDGIRIKFHDKRAALVDIGRHLGMFKEKVELTGKDGGPVQTQDMGRDLARRIALALASGGDT